MDWTQLLFIIGAALMLYLVYRTVKLKPDMFSKVNLGKSVYTMGLLALGLVAFVYILVLLLK